MSLMGQMMQQPLLISSLLQHAARHFRMWRSSANGSRAMCTARPTAVARRSRQFAQAMARLGCVPGDRIATLAWNGYRHLEIYYGSSGSRPGLPHHQSRASCPEQIAWIANDAQDAVLCFDLNFLPLVEARAAVTQRAAPVLMVGRSHMPAASSLPNLLCFDELVDLEDGAYTWPQLDENTASSICYTSGTRATPRAPSTATAPRSACHASALPDAMNCSARDAILPVVPMFHVNAWGRRIRRAGGAKLVLPGPHLDGKSPLRALRERGRHLRAGVPTVWLGLHHLRQVAGLKFSSFKRTVIGGSACPPAMMNEPFRCRRTLASGHPCLGHDRTVAAGDAANSAPSGWGCRPTSSAGCWRSGAVIYGIDMTIIDDDGRNCPGTGKAPATCVVRGGWSSTATRQRGLAAGQRGWRPGWFPTGDVATIDADGFMQITDRSKDVIKSGGEWISSIDLETSPWPTRPCTKPAVIAAKHPVGRAPTARRRQEARRQRQPRRSCSPLRGPHRQVADP